MNAYAEFISKLCELAIKLKRVSVTDKEVENEKCPVCGSDNVELIIEEE